MLQHKLAVEDWAAFQIDKARQYEEECFKAAATDAGKNFRSSDSKYMQTVVENSNPQFIREILYPVYKMCPWMLQGKWLKIAQQNDDFGNPVTVDLNGFSLSPTTARYMRHAAQLSWLFGPMHEWNIVEIGGGYGGLCRLFTEFFQPTSYMIYDIEGALAIQQKYLEQLNANKTVEYHSSIKLTRCNLVISIAALCELHRFVIDKFAEAVLSKSEHGYLAWSCSAEGLESTEEVIAWLQSYGIDATFGYDDFMFRSICTMPTQKPNIYYW